MAFAAAARVHRKSCEALSRRQRELERQQDAARLKTAELLGLSSASAPRPGRLGTAEHAFGVGDHGAGRAEERRRHTMGPAHAEEVAGRHAELLRERREHLLRIHEQSEQREARAMQAREHLAVQRGEALQNAAAERRARREAVIARKAAVAAEQLSAKVARTEARNSREPAAALPRRSDGGSARYTALHKACGNGDLEAVKTLLEAGASCSVAAPRGHTPLEMAALGGHRAVVVRLLQYRQPSQAEKMRCARFAMRHGYADVAALFVPPKLTKATQRTPSQIYAATGVLEPYTMRDGFYDAGASEVAANHTSFQSLARYAAMPPNLAQQEVVLVDARQDQELRAFGQRVRSEMAKLDTPDDTAAKVALLQKLVRCRLGLAALQPHVDMEKRSKVAIWSLQRQRRSRVISLGSVRLGVSRHQALLFKYIADAEDVRIPCRLVRGQGKEQEAWVEVHYVDGGGQDRWQPIGRTFGGSGVTDEMFEQETEAMCSTSGSDGGSSGGGDKSEGGTSSLLDGTTVVSGTSADTHEQVIDALSGQPRPGTSAAKRAAAAAEKARAQTPLGRIEAALDVCLARGRRDELGEGETWELLMDAVSDPEVASEAIKLDAPPPPPLRLCPMAAELRAGLFDGTVLNMAHLHKGYSGGWLAEHRRRPPQVRAM